LENKITGRESQGACHQDDLIGREPPVITSELQLVESHTVKRRLGLFEMAASLGVSQLKHRKF
jgi:hypothetical protein